LEREVKKTKQTAKGKSKAIPNLMQHCAGFISADSLYMFRAQAPIIRII
jgi:hypothetical protein